MTERPTFVIRPSLLSAYNDCPRRAAAKAYCATIEDAGYPLRRLENSAGAAVGIGVHKGAEHTLRTKLLTGALAPWDETADAALEAFREQIRLGVTWSDDTPGLSAGEQQVRRMMSAYQLQVAPTVQPVGVEVRLEADLPAEDGDLVRWVLSGRYDSITKEPFRLRDLKTGAVVRPHAPQVGSYAMLAKASGAQVDELVVDHVPRVSLRKPQPPAHTIAYDLTTAQADAWAVIQQVRRHVGAFLASGDPREFPANPMSSLCSDKWCPAWGTTFCTSHAKR